ncbi:hypothetical protein GCM10011316_15350 [Roseibium aquae]|uniref:Lipid A biosynthesis lauroyl acyltransferase n=1 Tax=Roseibium aquae TaxID=1323746 RepID=A0A916TJC9_9HYPH|nr:hypothetical protein [Roseibium aquae]GGB44265.1 hypothetical protein GCM10011316_15350 [Roseibium aquae]
MASGQDRTPPVRLRSPRALRLKDIPFEETRPDEPLPPAFRDLWSKDPEAKHAANLYWNRHFVDGTLNSLTHHALKLLPVDAVSRFGAWASALAYARYENRIFAQRIKRNFGALTLGRWQNPDERQTGLKRWWSNIGRSNAEFSVVNRLWRAGRIEVMGAEHIAAVRAAGRLPMFVSVHLATWEAVFVAIHEGLAGPSIGPFQPEPNRFSNRIVHNLRKARNQYLFPPGQRSAYRLRRLLCEGEATLTIFIDEVRDHQVHFPLFGRPAPERGNAVVAVKLANAANGSLLPVHLARLSDARFRLTICPPIPRSDMPYDIAGTIEQLNSVFEPEILARIEEWYMMAELRLPDDFETSAYASQLHRNFADH